MSRAVDEAYEIEKDEKMKRFAALAMLASLFMFNIGCNPPADGGDDGGTSSTTSTDSGSGDAGSDTADDGHSDDDGHDHSDDEGGAEE